MQASKPRTDAESRRTPDPAPVQIPRKDGSTKADAPIDDGRTELSLDDVFGVLSNPRRRAAIHYLNDREDELIQLRDLAEQLAAWENDVAIEEVTYKQRKRVYTSLYQSHLPKMDDLSIVQFDKHRGTIEWTRWTAALGKYLDDIENHDADESWPTPGRRAMEVGIAVVTGVAVGSIAIGAGALLGIVVGLCIATLAAVAGRVLHT